MPAPTDKARENRLRRAASRQGLTLGKSRARDPLADTYGRYILTPASTGSDAEGRTARPKRSLEDGDGVSLDAIEAFLRWDDIFVIPPDIEDLGTLDYPLDRAIVEYVRSGGVGWQVSLLNDGNPLDYSIGLGPADSDDAREDARQWLRGYWR